MLKMDEFINLNFISQVKEILAANRHTMSYPCESTLNEPRGSEIFLSGNLSTDGDRKLNFSLFGAFLRHRVCNIKPQSSTRTFPVCGKEQNHIKKGNIRLPIAVLGSRTSVLDPNCTTLKRRWGRGVILHVWWWRK